MRSDLHHHQQIRFHSRLSWCLFVFISEIETFGNAGLGTGGPPQQSIISILFPEIYVKNYLAIQQHVVGI